MNYGRGVAEEFQLIVQAEAAPDRSVFAVFSEHRDFRMGFKP